MTAATLAPLRPGSEADLAAIIREAAGPLAIRGGGTRPVGGIPAAAQVVETAALAGIRLYDPGALTLVVGAGTPLAEVEAAVAAEGQRLPFEPMDWSGLLSPPAMAGPGALPPPAAASGPPEPACASSDISRPGAGTIGGLVAANASGPRRVQAGACRDSLIGVRFVDGTGMVVKNGGRVMKNVTGYDLVKLMAGSWGTLGVLTEVAFKLLPAAPAQATLILPDLGPEAAVAALSSALTSPYDVSGAGWLPGIGAMVRVEGLAGSVDHRAAALGRRLSAFGRVEERRDGALWRDLGEVRPFHGRAGDVWRFNLRPSEAPSLIARLGDDVVLDWGGGLVWALLPEGADPRAPTMTGHATRMRGPGPGAFPPEPPGVARLAVGLRARFDPRGILNPGRMG